MQSDIDNIGGLTGETEAEPVGPVGWLSLRASRIQEFRRLPATYGSHRPRSTRSDVPQLARVKVRSLTGPEEAKTGSCQARASKHHKLRRVRFFPTSRPRADPRGTTGSWVLLKALKPLFRISQPMDNFSITAMNVA